MSTPLHVLILEDRPTDAELILYELRRAGYDPDWQCVETEADYLAHLEPTLDLILADYSLPQFDALRALHHLQERELDIPFIVVTASIEEAAIECMKQGAADYLLKDRLGRLGQAISRALEQKSLRDEKRRAEKALQRHNLEFEVLYRTSLEINAQLDLSTLLRTIVARAVDLLGARMGGLYLMKPDGESLELVVNHNLPRDYTGTILQLGEGLAGRIAQSGETMMVEDYQNWEGRASVYSQDTFRKVLGVPLKAGDRLIGVINIIDDQKAGLFSDEEVRLVSLFADQAAIAVENTRLLELSQRELAERKQAEEQLRESAARLKALDAVSQVLVEVGPDYRIALDLLAKRIAELLGDFCVIRLIADDGQWLHTAAMYHTNPEALALLHKLSEATGSKSVNSVLDEQVIKTGQSVLVSVVTPEQTWSVVQPEYLPYLGRFGVESILITPLRAQGRVIGTIGLTRGHHGSPYTLEDQTFLQELADRTALAIANARLYAENLRRLEHVQALREIDTAITGSVDLHVILKVILDKVSTQLGVDAADVLTYNPHMQTLDFVTGRGFRTYAFQATHLHLGQDYAGRAAMERRAIQIPNLNAAPAWAENYPHLKDENFVFYYAVPLSSKGQIKGVMELFHCSSLTLDQEWMDFLESLAGQAAIAIDNANLFEDLQRSNIELMLAYDATIEGWSRALDLRDKETEGHTLRVTEMSVRLGRAMGLDDEDLVHTRRGALLHDIGKMGVPDGILLKPAALTDEEWVIMRKHPQYAYDMLAPISYLHLALDIPYCHHEKWDGTGYPRGLKGEQIPQAARIFAVVDVWDALISDRPYRLAWSKNEALEYIKTLSGKHFDSRVIEFFLQVFKDEIL
jgi:HD-GYP domain-containing protein (c-di-GMP phosphodiesterase class II)/CheY-like chemotaxis protein/putative methionine-R-sulfoxide reductase with GAF domain